MKHDLDRTTPFFAQPRTGRPRPVIGLASGYTVICTCGWKAQAPSKPKAIVKHDEHVKQNTAT